MTTIPCCCRVAAPDDEPPQRLRDKLPALAALVTALASSIVLTLAGCAGPAGIAPNAQALGGPEEAILRS